MKRDRLSARLVFLVAAIIIGGGCRTEESAAEKDACANNLRMIDEAKREWALEHKDYKRSLTWEELSLYAEKGHQVMPKCPAGGTYTIGDCTRYPSCSFPGHDFPEWIKKQDEKRNRDTSANPTNSPKPSRSQ